MALHGLAELTLGVPDLSAAAAFYEDFGLTRSGSATFATIDGGDQLHLVHSPVRRLMQATFAADDLDDLAEAGRSLGALGVGCHVNGETLSARDPGSRALVALTVRHRQVQPRHEAAQVNAPGRIDRVAARAAGIVATGRVRPRRLGHLVLGTTDFEASCRFFVDGLGFRVSDLVRDVGVFLRCSNDHHNILVQRAPVSFLHHTSWQVEDVDAIGRGARDLLAEHPERHVWGLGRHYAGSNFFWYFRDPAGNFAEYHSDMDCIPDDAIWTAETLSGTRGLYEWGPPPPPSFIKPDDLTELMAAGHSVT